MKKQRKCLINQRQWIYLRAIFQATFDQEQQEKTAGCWILYNAAGSPLLERLRQAGVRDPGKSMGDSSPPRSLSRGNRTAQGRRPAEGRTRLNSWDGKSCGGRKHELAWQPASTAGAPGAACPRIARA